MSYAKLGIWMDPEKVGEYLDLSLKGVRLSPGIAPVGRGYALKQRYVDGEFRTPMDEWKDCTDEEGVEGGFRNGEELDAHVYDTEKSIIIKAELPGVKENEIHIDMMDNVLTIRIDNSRGEIAGKNRQAGESDADGLKKSFVLPKNVFLFPEMVRATLTDGIFKVEILKCSKT